MGRTPRIYADVVNAGNPFETVGQEWQQGIAPDMAPPSAPYFSIDYAITIGSGSHTQSFSEVTIWLDGVVSLGLPTDAQIAFMSKFEPDISKFPGFYISAGYTDAAAGAVSDGNYDDGYGVEIATGKVDFTPLPDGTFQLSDAVPVTRITWATMSSHDLLIDKQILLAPNFFIIGNVEYDDQGAGYSLGGVSVDGGTELIPDGVNYQEDYFAKLASDFYGAGRSDFLIENTQGWVEVGAWSGSSVSFGLVADIGPEWRFRGAGDFFGFGHSDFLVENTAGAVVVGEVVKGQAQFTQVAGLGPEWKFVGSGDFLSLGRDQFLIENTAGSVAVGDVEINGVVFTAVGGLGPEWKFVEAGSFLGHGKTDFLIENTAGAVVIGEVANGQAAYTQAAGLGSEWKFVGAADFLGEGHDQFLIENTSGAVYVGDWTGGAMHFTQTAALGPEWSFVGSGDYLAEGHSQFLIENSAGAVFVGDWTGGAMHFTQVAGLGPEWTFH